MTMSFTVDNRKATVPARKQRAELESVALDRSITVDGRTLPEGSRGTVVAVYVGGGAYEIEFERPFHAVATVEAADLAG